MGSRGVRAGVPPQPRLAPPTPVATSADDGGGADRQAQTTEAQPMCEVAQLTAVGVRQVARVAVRAAHEGGDPGAVTGVQAVPVVAACAQDLEDDQPGN